MDSRIAIARGIADLNCSPEVKSCLSALFNRELISSAGSQVTQISYSHEVELHFDKWDPTEDAVSE